MRREMMAGGIPEWDYEWDASKGLLENNGWNVSRVSTGNSSYSITNGYLRTYSTSSTYYNFQYPDTYTKGVLEAEVYMEASQNIIRLNVCGNSTYSFGVRLQYSSNYKGIYLGTTVTTKLASISYGRKYKVKLVLNESVGQVYMDDVLIADNIDTSVDMDCANAFFSGRGAGNTARYNRLYSLKMKFGRI